MVIQEQTIDAGSKVASIGGGGATVYFGLTASETAAVVGAIVAVVGLVVQVWYVFKKNKRAEEIHQLAIRNKNVFPVPPGETED